MCVLSDAWRTFTIWVRNNLFLKNLFTSEGAVSYYQQLSVARYQVKFVYANNHFKHLPISQSAFKRNTHLVPK